MIFLLNLIIKFKKYLQLTFFKDDSLSVNDRIKNILIWLITLIIGLIVLRFIIIANKYQLNLNNNLLLKKENSLKLLNKLNQLDGKNLTDFLFNLMQQDKVYVNYNNHLYQNLVTDATINNSGGKMNIYIKEANKNVTIDHVTQFNEFHYP